MKKRHSFDDQHGGPASTATVEDLASALEALAEAERQRAIAVAALARVAARGDGEAACGMPVDQHLRWQTNLRHGTVSTIQVICDVAADLPTVMVAHLEGRLNLDQVAAVAWPAARVPRHVRRSLDASLAEGDDGMRLAPDGLELEVERLLEDLQPKLTEQQERQARERQYVHTQSTLDGQGLRFWGQANGVDAALFDATLRAASALPGADEPTGDGMIVRRHTRRSEQLFEGLMRILRSWAANAGEGASDATGTGANVTIYALVDERAEAAGTGELLTASQGLAPRLSAKAVRDLEAAGARRIEIAVRDGEPVAILGRPGHVIDDPDGLSDDSIRILCTVRDAHCRMPGCRRPVEHLHHLVWQALARARGQVSPDDPRHRAGLCTRCHLRVVHRWRWAGTVGTVGRTTWTRPATRTTPAITATTEARLARRLRPPPPPTVHLDPDGEPLPF